MGIREMVDGDEESLGVAGEEKIKENDRHDDRCEQPTDWGMDGEIQGQIDDNSKDASRAVIDDPGRGEEVTRFPLVRIAAAWTSIQGGEPVTQGSCVKKGSKNR